ncbi:MAG: NADP oxidoreductase, partial [Hyphomonas sp. 32-62-5]
VSCAANAEIARIMDRSGFFGADLGSLPVGTRLGQVLGRPLSGLDLVKFD